ncbi:hypothetical protein GJV82_13140 [Cellulosimicrobium sp. BIT-GX5]|uniref:PH domain-containing protein n=1 Tax=Cellulosimicrobium composti TaxID=2672572 RepID=A0A6N7ZKR7_9MICO|nr:hypothetical protein [Cellulosimicrobium composti]MTG89883.1 hypothetical protein [Cellulosimicrobium composti]
MREVIAQEQPRSRWYWIGPVCGFAGLAGATHSLAGGRTAMVLFIGFFAVLLTLMLVELFAPVDRRQVIATDERLFVGRWWRVVSIARQDVRAVRGDVPNRPTWSDRVIVEHVGGELTLGRYEQPPAVVIQRLQEWAGVGERPNGPA